MTDKPSRNVDTRKARSSRRAPRPPSGIGKVIVGDVRHFSPWRAVAVARLAVKEALRLKVLGVILLGLLAIVLADLTTRRFDPVFDTAGSMVRVAELVITIVGLVLAIFLSTYSLPREMASRTIYSLVTKPVSRLEIVVGKTVGVVVVLAMVTFGLGLLSLGYFRWRGGQVQQLASERYQQWKENTESPPLPTDAPPAGLKAVADHGPFKAARYRSPSGPMAVVTFPSRQGAERSAGGGLHKLEWLTGAPDHTAHWGFEDLPIDDIDGGKARVALRIVLAKPLDGEQVPDGPAPEEHRRVLVRLHVEGFDARPDWSGTLTVGADGRLEVPIPAKAAPDASAYHGQRFWVSLCGVETPPLGVGDDSCAVLPSTGKPIGSRSGLKLTTSFSLGRYWIGGPLLAGRVRFRGIPADRIGRDGTVLEVSATVPSASSIPPDARARVIVVDETTGAQRNVTFRPEKRAAAIVPLSRDDFAGGDLAVYVKSDHPRVEIGANDLSFRLQLTASSEATLGAFALNWLKDLTMMWLTFSVLAGIGVLASTWAGWHVATLLTAVMFIVANVWPSIIATVQRHGVSLSGRMVHNTSGFQRLLVGAYRGIFGLLGAILPSFGRLDYGDLLARGVDAPLGALFAVPDGALWYALVYVAATVLIGYLSFSFREVAR